MPIEGATSDEYTTTDADVDHDVRFVVTATNEGGSAELHTSPESIEAALPINVLAPTIEGTPTDGSTLTADPGTWSGAPTPTFSYQWLLCEVGEKGPECQEVEASDAQ